MRLLILFLICSIPILCQNEAKAVKQNDTSYIHSKPIEYKTIEINSMGVVSSRTARIFPDKEYGGNTVEKLSRGDSVYIYDFYPSLSVCRVSFQNKFGFIEQKEIKSEKITDYFNNVAKEIELKNEEKAEKQSLGEEKEQEEQRLNEEKNLKERKTKFIKKYGKKWGTIVAEKKIQIGMTDKMVIDSWGEPDDKNRSIGNWGVHEQWVYGAGQYLYIENGKLTSWQD